MLTTDISLIYIHWIQYITIIRSLSHSYLFYNLCLKTENLKHSSTFLGCFKFPTTFLMDPKELIHLLIVSKMTIVSYKFPAVIYLLRKMHSIHPYKSKFQ